MHPVHVTPDEVHQEAMNRVARAWRRIRSSEFIASTMRSRGRREYLIPGCASKLTIVDRRP